MNGAFEIETDALSGQEWDHVLSQFADANLFQSWCYARARWNAKNLSHLVLRRRKEIVGVAQVILVKVPIVRGGLAYVKWGPLWQPRRGEPDREVLRQLLAALRDVYAAGRGLLLRVSPWEFADEGMRALLEEQGFLRNVASNSRTVVLDLSHSMESLRGSLSRHWRYNLTQAEKKGLEVRWGHSGELLEEFFRLYGEMRARKTTSGWIPPISYFREVQRAAPGDCKPQIAICRLQGEPVAGLVVSSVGVKAVALFAATGTRGLEARGSYLLQWQAIQRLKEQGVRWYDLGGIDEKSHPGTTQFKLGLCGKLGQQAEYLGEFHACQSGTSHLLVQTADYARMALIKARESLREWQHARGSVQP